MVVSQSKGMAVALKEANGGARISWCTDNYKSKQTNTHFVNGLDDALTTNITSGYDETWTPSYTHSNVTGNKVKAQNPDFPAFNAAAEYDPGVTYTGSPALKWYLPSYSDWTWVFTALGLGDRSSLGTSVSSLWNGYLANLAFTQVGGTSIYTMGYSYWSSSETWSGAGDVGISWMAFLMDRQSKGNTGSNCSVRPFVKYK